MSIQTVSSASSRQADSTSSPTPSPREKSNRGGWLRLAVLVAVLVAVLLTVMRGLYRDGPLEPDAPTGQGSLAVASVLGDLGVSVQTQRDTESAAEDLREGRTVLVTEPESLNKAQLDALSTAWREGTGRLVLVRPSFTTLMPFKASIFPAGTVTTNELLEADATCGPASFGAQQVALHENKERTLQASLYRPVEGGDASVCFRHDNAGLVAVNGRLTVLGSTDLLTNDAVGSADNSVVALNALHSDKGVTWYIPSPYDPMATGSKSLLNRVPAWAFPLGGWIVAMTLLALWAASWRLGPVVVEPLPVRVRAQELVLGRAHLLQQSRSRDATAQALRAAAASRLAGRLGVRCEASLDALLSALEPHTTSSREQVRALLSHSPVPNDEALLRLAQDLDHLEKEIER